MERLSETVKYTRVKNGNGVGREFKTLNNRLVTNCRKPNTKTRKKKKKKIQER
jgi:hypothetical protein